MKRSLISILLFMIIGAHLLAAVTVNVNGTNHTIPETGEQGWGDNVTAWIQDISADSLQKNGGNFTLTADVNFGSTYGLEAAHFTSGAASPADAGVLRLAVSDDVAFRNNADDGNLLLSVDGSDRLTFDGALVTSGLAVSDTSTVDLTLSTSTISADLITDSITNSLINSAAGIVYSKLDLTGGVVNADVNASAAIDASKISAGDVSNTEFDYLNGVTSALQTQLDGKMDEIVSIDQEIPRFDGTSGDLEQSGVIINDAGSIRMSGASDIQIPNGRELQLEELSVNGTDAVRFQAPENLAADVELTFPGDDGDADELLSTDGSGVLDWFTPIWVEVAGDSMTGDLNMDNGTSVLFSETDANGSHYVEVKAPDSVTATVTLTLPDGDGDADDFLKTDGSGNLSWDSPSGLLSTSSITADPSPASTSVDVYYADASGGAFTITLPSAASADAHRFTIYKTDTGTNEVTVDANSTEVINGQEEIDLAGVNEALTIESDGTSWVIESHENVKQQVIADTCVGTGSTNTRILDMLNSSSSGNAVGHSSTTASGDIFTANRTGLYFISLRVQNSSTGREFGIVKNPSNGVTNTTAHTASKVLSTETTYADRRQETIAIEWLEEGDEVIGSVDTDTGWSTTAGDCRMLMREI